jgi:hypothetical protein
VAPAIIPDACLNPGDDLTGAIDTFLTGAGGASRLELLLNGTVVDTFTPAAPARAVRNIAAAAPARGRRTRGARAGAEEGGDGDKAVITWTESGAKARGRGPRAARVGSDRVYTVQVSTDDGTTWQTVAFGLREPQATIDRQAFGDAGEVRIRITSHDGFRSVSTERKLKATDL